MSDYRKLAHIKPKKRKRESFFKVIALPKHVLQAELDKLFLRPLTTKPL